jgi:hypothetical protein
MTDYQPLIARAIEGLGKSTGEARRALYERARSALVTQLRSVEPALSESEITRERLSLEEAIRKVEADAARKSRMEARTEPRFEPRPLKPPSRPAPAAMPAPPPAVPAPPAAEPPQPEPLKAHQDEPPQPPEYFDEPEQAEPPPPPPPPPRPIPSTARGRLLSARTPSLSRDGLRGFRDVVHDVDDLGSASARAAQSARDTRDTYEPQPRRLPRDDDTPPAPYEPELDLDDLGAHDDDPRHPQSLEQSFELDEERPFPSQSARAHSSRPPGADDDYEHTRPPRSYSSSVFGGFIKLAVVACIIGIVAALFVWQWPNMKRMVAQFGARQPAQTTPAPAPSEPKFSGRVPQEQTPGQAPNSGAPGNQAAPAVAQRVVLYEEDPNDPQGKRFVGSAIWRTETVSPGAGLAPELAVRADIEIPDRRMTVTWSLRRNTDKALPASHTIEIMFNLPADFPGGGIANVPGVLMKQAEQARGTPLAGLAVKVTNGFFLIGLSAVDADRQRNMQLLKDQEWFDVPIVYTNGGRAIMAVEKGPPGDRAFADAFAAWAK